MEILTLKVQCLVVDGVPHHLPELLCHCSHHIAGGELGLSQHAVPGGREREGGREGGREVTTDSVQVRQPWFHSGVTVAVVHLLVSKLSLPPQYGPRAGSQIPSVYLIPRPLVLSDLRMRLGVSMTAVLLSLYPLLFPLQQMLYFCCCHLSFNSKSDFQQPNTCTFFFVFFFVWGGRTSPLPHIFLPSLMICICDYLVSVLCLVVELPR